MDGWTANDFHCCSLHIHLGHARSGTAMLMYVVNPADVVPGIPNNSFRWCGGPGPEGCLSIDPTFSVVVGVITRQYRSLSNQCWNGSGRHRSDNLTSAFYGIHGPSSKRLRVDMTLTRKTALLLIDPGCCLIAKFQELNLECKIKIVIEVDRNLLVGVDTRYSDAECYAQGASLPQTSGW